MTDELMLASILSVFAMIALVVSVRAQNEAEDRVDAYHAAVQYARDKGLMLPTVIEAVDAQFFPQSAGEKEK